MHKKIVSMQIPKSPRVRRKDAAASRQAEPASESFQQKWLAGAFSSTINDIQVPDLPKYNATLKKEITVNGVILKKGTTIGVYQTFSNRHPKDKKQYVIAGNTFDHLFVVATDEFRPVVVSDEEMPAPVKPPLGGWGPKT